MGSRLGIEAGCAAENRRVRSEVEGVLLAFIPA
jgi:hypothetical protein